MADLYGSNESEDMSSFLQILLNNSSAAAATTDSSASAPAGGLFSSGGAPTAVAESSSRINFSDYSSFFPKDSDEINPSNRVKKFVSNFEVSEASEGQVNPVLARSSSKRSRAAEVHNLSEKRRRSRINEKLKALQNLIPNSNKTDKASMLDEAIEYLKQLQLQVQLMQMLTMRNGLSLHPGYSLGSLQSMLIPPPGVDIHEGNVLLNPNRPENALSTTQDVLVPLEATNPTSSTQPMLVPSVGNINNSGTLPTFSPSVENHYGLLNHLTSAKDTLSRLQLGCSGNSSSPGMSS